MRGRVHRGFHGRPGRGRTPRGRRIALESQRYSVDELREQLRRFERELRAAGLKESSVTTYVDRTGRFLKWLDGDYQPRGPN
jgi:hypothetical protein